MKKWLLAARFKTLPAAISPIIVGSSLAYHDGAFYPITFFVILLTAILIQIGTNFSNDVYDFLNGSDREDRIGPKRLTQSGDISPIKMKRAMWTTFSVAVILGIYLVLIGGWPIVLIGLASIAAGIVYTAGPYPIGYHGLGDLFVFIFFGLIAVPGTYYLHIGGINNISINMGIIIGMLSTAILVVNNLRDIETDKLSGKNTLAVLLGKKFTKFQYSFLVSLPFLYPMYMWYSHNKELSLLLVIFSLPLSVKLIFEIFILEGEKLNSMLSRTARLLFVFSILLSLGLIL